MRLKFIDNQYVDLDTGQIITEGEPGELNKLVVLSKDTIIHFGKYKGKTMLEIGGDDPKYIKWLKETGFCVYDVELKATKKRVSYTSHPHVYKYPPLMLTELGIETGFDVFKRQFGITMDAHMMDKHPEIFGSEWEDNLDFDSESY